MISNFRKHALQLVVTIAALLCCAATASACPTCKDSLTENYVNAYGWSIVFMMSMPFLIFGSLATYFWWEVRKARLRQQGEVGQQGA